MKTRKGFVSNSSSSSFVLLGVKVESEEDVIVNKMKISIEDIIKEQGVSFKEEIDWYDVNDKHICKTGFEYLGEENIFGILIGDQLEEYSIESVEVEKLMEGRDKLIKLGFNPDEIKLYYGSRCC